MSPPLWVIALIVIVVFLANIASTVVTKRDMQGLEQAVRDCNTRPNDKKPVDKTQPTT